VVSDVHGAAHEAPVSAAIYQLDGLVRRAPSLQATRDGRAAFGEVQP
jgi:NADH-quinone oxidoreductase subunit G